MKNYTAICFFLAIALILCPLASMGNAKSQFSSNVFGEEPITEEAFEQDAKPPEEKVKILSTSSKAITEMPLKEYLIDCVAGEIGASYEKEAIKAQAVACHTLLLYKKTHKTEDLGSADISDTNQKLLTEKEQKEKWGESYTQNRSKIEECVNEVINKVLCFENEPIMAVYFSTSNGKTENAENVWNKALPYLISVDSPYDKLSGSYKSTVTVSEENFKKILTENGARCEGSHEALIGKKVQNTSGTVKEITLGGKSFKGTEVRSMFSLKSATFDIAYKDGNFIFTVLGYGHSVGMSQVGANAMAKNGNTYQEILSHYYQNSVLSTIEQ